MSDRSGVARAVLGVLNRDVVPQVKKNGQCAKEFEEELGKALRGPGPYSISLMHYGSAYEGLAVDKKADFDIAVVLDAPFESENFKVTRDASGYFTLEWKSHVPNTFLHDCDGYLDAGKVRHELFGGLIRGVSRVQIPGAQVKSSKGVAAVKVEIEYNTGNKVSIDLVPQIVFRTWGQCPDLKPLQELPKTLRCYIDTLNKNKSPIMFFTLNAPDAQNYSNPDQLFSVSFALLEKKFLTSNVELRDMVRLVKLVAKQRDWVAKWWFQSFFAKRLAVKYCDELKGKDLWEGYKAILGYLSQAVERGYLDGYFINNQVAFKWEPEEALEFQKDIAMAMKIDPRVIQSSLYTVVDKRSSIMLNANPIIKKGV